MRLPEVYQKLIDGEMDYSTFLDFYYAAKRESYEEGCSDGRVDMEAGK